MRPRPKVKLELTSSDKVFEFLGWVATFVLWILTLVNYTHLPDSIPIHFNGLGEVDDYGGKGYILTLPPIATILFIGLTILNKFPHIFNYPTEITEENALKQYTIATRLIRYLKFIIVFVFGIIVMHIIRSANGQSCGFGIWLLLMIMGFIFIPLVYYLVQAYKNSK